MALIEFPVRPRDEEEKLLWGFAEKRIYTPKHGYPIIHASHKPDSLDNCGAAYGS